MLSSLYISQMIDYIDGIPFEGPAIDPYIDGTLSILTGSEFTQVGPFAFYSCSTLEAIEVPAYGVGSQAFENCSALSEAVLNNSNYTYIYTSAFKNCTSLATVSGIICNIYSDAFNGCTNLMSVYVGSSYCALSNSNAFANTPIVDSALTGDYGSIYVPVSMVATFQSSSVWSYFSDRIVGHDFNPPISGITPTLKDMVEQGRSAFTALYEPSASVVGYGNTLFAGTNLSLVSLPEVEAIWSGGAFGGCSSLKDIFLPKCKQIYGAFAGCNALTEISLPALTSLYDSAFNGCTNVEKVSFPELVDLQTNAFGGWGKLSSVYMPKVKNLYSAFGGCTSLYEANFPEVSYISGTFAGCTGLQYISLPKCSYLYLSAWAGAARSNIKAIYAPCYSSDYTSPGLVPGLFALCSNLSLYEVPWGGNIYSNVFKGTSIDHIALLGCQWIGDGAFADCSNLSSVYLGYYPYTSSQCINLYSSVFDNTPIAALSGTIYVPSDMLSEYQVASNWSEFSTIMQPWDPATYVPTEYVIE